MTMKATSATLQPGVKPMDITVGSNSSSVPANMFAPVLFVLCMGILVSLPVRAEPAPEQVIQMAVEELLEEFTLRRGELEGDHPALYHMVARVTHPYFDFSRISKLVLAQNWKSASSEQRRQFGMEFRKLLIRTYATALFQYSGDGTMAFNTTRIKERGGMKFATVESEITLADGPPIPLSYSMILDGDGRWKIYNMTIAGVNLVTNYRKIYNASIRSLGLDGLIGSMREANHVMRPG